MKEFVLKVDNSCSDLGASLGISRARSLELEEIIKEIVQTFIDGDEESASISRLVQMISERDITPEEYTFILLQLGKNMAENSEEPDDEDDEIIRGSDLSN